MYVRTYIQSVWGGVFLCLFAGSTLRRASFPSRVRMCTSCLRPSLLDSSLCHLISLLYYSTSSMVSSFYHCCGLHGFEVEKNQKLVVFALGLQLIPVTRTQMGQEKVSLLARCPTVFQGPKMYERVVVHAVCTYVLGLERCVLFREVSSFQGLL